MTTLRVPPLVSQNIATLPDGAVDPEHANDCGESCLSSATGGLLGLFLAPGCIRMAVSSPQGYTTAEQLSWFLGRLRIGGAILQPDFAQFQELRHYGRYLIALGTWIQPTFEHWMLAYEGTGDAVLFMDPWTGLYSKRTKEIFDTQYSLQAVQVNHTP